MTVPPEQAKTLITPTGKPGIYSVTLTASDIYTSISHSKRNYITVVNTPHADFSADKTKGITPFTVKFTDRSTGSPTGWTWDFGDGGTSSEQNPHAYLHHLWQFFDKQVYSDSYCHKSEWI